jgi:hypothetical protein
VARGACCTFNVVWSILVITKGAGLQNQVVALADCVINAFVVEHITRLIWHFAYVSVATTFAICPMPMLGIVPTFAFASTAIQPRLVHVTTMEAVFERNAAASASVIVSQRRHWKKPPVNSNKLPSLQWKKIMYILFYIQGTFVAKDENKSVDVISTSSIPQTAGIICDQDNDSCLKSGVCSCRLIQSDSPVSEALVFL